MSEEITPKPNPRTHDRLTVRANVYFQALGEMPVEAEGLSFSRFSEPGEEPYSRRLMIDEEWQLLDTSYIEDVGYIVIINRVGSVRMVNPSPEQLEEEAKQVLEIRRGVGDGEWEIRPGEFFCGSPTQNQIYLRSRHGKIPVRVHVYPK